MKWLADKSHGETAGGRRRQWSFELHVASILHPEADGLMDQEGHHCSTGECKHSFC